MTALSRYSLMIGTACVVLGLVAIVRGVRGAELDGRTRREGFAIHVGMPGKPVELIDWLYAGRTSCELDLSSFAMARRDSLPKGTHLWCAMVRR